MDRRTTVDTYTSTAWKPDYTALQQDELLHNGRHFVFEGNIEEIIETGQKNVFTVSQESQSDQIYYVEFWGTSILTLEIGSGFSETAGVIRTVIPDFWQNISTTKNAYVVGWI